jgi:type I restriction enzyme S subunit
MRAVDEMSGTVLTPEIRPYGEISSGYTYIGEGDVLFAKITPCMENGKHAIATGLVDGIAFGTTEFHVLRPTMFAAAEWIHHFIRQPTFLREAEQHFRGGVGQQRVPTDFLANYPIPLPPLPEQRRIAAVLREALGAVRRAREAALARLEAARALPAAFLRSVFESEEAQSWPRVRLAVAISETRNGLYKPEEFYGRGTPILKMFNIGQFDGYWYLERLDRIELTADELADFRLSDGDILVNRVNSGELVGKCAVIDSSTAGAVFESKNIRLRVIANPHFVAEWINSRYGREQLETHANRAVGQWTISRDTLERLQLPLPARDEQDRAAEKMRTVRDLARTSLRPIESELATIDAVPQSLLRQAFDGQL